MNGRIHRTVILAVCWLAVGAPWIRAGDSDRNPCPIASVGVVVPSEVSTVLAIQDFVFSSKGGRASTSWVLRNKTQHALVELLVLTQLTDGNGSYLLTIPTHAAATPSYRLFLTDALANIAQDLQEPVADGATLTLTTVTPIATRRCPTRAEVRLALLRFDDQTVHAYAAPDWRMEPSMVSADEFLEDAPPLTGDFATLIVELQLDADGFMESMTPLGPGDKHLFSWFAGKASKWSFSPAVLRGNVAKSQLTLLVRFHRSIEKPADASLMPDSLPTIFTIVDIFPADPKQGRWLLVYGGVGE